MAVPSRMMGRRNRRRSRGQAMVEFSLVLLPFLTLIVATIEFSFLLTAKIGVTNTAQDAVQLASRLGNSGDADFQVLQLVEMDISAPLSKSKIVSIEIFSTDVYGKINNGEDKYTRGGSYANPLDTTKTVPYLQVSTGYLPASRCNTVTVSVCGGVDYVGVIVTYKYSWVTPLPNLAGLGSTAPTFVQSSVSRLEPIQ